MITIILKCGKIIARVSDFCLMILPLVWAWQYLIISCLYWQRPLSVGQLVKKLVKICKQPLCFKPAESLRTYLLSPEQKHLFTFLRHPGVQPTNNHAEQSQRALVIFRKICFGTRSESGLKTHSILPSLLQTARRQRVHPREFLQTLLTSNTATAQAALYNNSS